jgi:uncharacterized protein (DUF2141 family)
VKRIIYFLFVLLFSFSTLVFSSDGVKNKGKLVIKFNGMNSNNGNVKIALCNSDANYQNHKSPFIGKTIPIENNSAIIEIDDLPFGEYAVKAFHDEDANDDLNTNILGIPVEDYGFSNNASGLFGLPSWEDAKFRFYDKSKIVEIVID